MRDSVGVILILGAFLPSARRRQPLERFAQQGLHDGVPAPRHELGDPRRWVRLNFNEHVPDVVIQ